MANMKRLEKRLENGEKWLKEFEKGTGPAQTMDNMNFLVGQTRIIGEQMQNLQNQNMELQTWNQTDVALGSPLKLEINGKTLQIRSFGLSWASD